MIISAESASCILRGVMRSIWGREMASHWRSSDPHCDRFADRLATPILSRTRKNPLKRPDSLMLRLCESPPLLPLRTLISSERRASWAREMLIARKELVDEHLAQKERMSAKLAEPCHNEGATDRAIEKWEVVVDHDTTCWGS